MRLPRWLVVSLLSLSVSTVFGTSAFCWVAWPERIVRTFVGFVSNRDYDQATHLMSHELAEAMRVELKYWALVEEFWGKDSVGNTFAEVVESDVRFKPAHGLTRQPGDWTARTAQSQAVGWNSR